MSELSALKIGIALVIFMSIQFFASKNLPLVSAVVANIPIFTIFAFTSNVGLKTPNMSLSLGVFTLAISLAYFAIYFLKIENKDTALYLFVTFWVMFTAVSYFLIKSLK